MFLIHLSSPLVLQHPHKIRREGMTIPIWKQEKLSHPEATGLCKATSWYLMASNIEQKSLASSIKNLHKAVSSECPWTGFSSERALDTKSREWSWDIYP